MCNCYQVCFVLVDTKSNKQFASISFFVNVEIHGGDCHFTVLTVTNVGSVITTAGVSLLVMWKSGFFEEETNNQLVTNEDTKPEMIKKIPDYEAYDNDELEENTKNQYLITVSESSILIHTGQEQNLYKTN